ncbi:response regulator [Paenibacillus sp. IB182496]|uniref:histidine kinase n=1 Tax=Paenibacillus sabuli TaxID=2772509 RepID=A0A927GST5_9BACL|nr:ATP-binding protein [Paenibacillus sabuli]MBD2846903.1 response regulator [Paenibacillus sabuli]
MRQKWMTAVVGIVLLVLLPVYWVGASVMDQLRSPEARSGYLDLTEWQFAQDGTIRLSGEWEFYGGRLLTPEDFRGADEGGGHLAQPDLVRLPGSWNGYLASRGASGEGYGTYRLRIQLPEDATSIYGVRTSNIRMANRVYLGDVLVGSGGVPSSEGREAEVPYNVPYVGFAAVQGPTVDLLVQVSNYNYSSGGIIYPLRFGDQQAILSHRDRALLLDLIMAAGFLIPALFFIVLYRLRSSERSLLYLTLLGLSGLVYVMTHGEKLLAELVPSMPYELLGKLQFYSSALVWYGFLQYVAVSFPQTIHRQMLAALKLATLSLLAVCLVLPMRIFSYLEIPVLTVGLLTVGYVLYVMVRALRQQSANMLPLAVSVQSIAVSILASTLTVLGLLEDQTLVSYEMLIFVMAQALLIAQRFATSFQEVEDLSERLLTLDGLKDEFLANTSHELRTPLHGMINIADTVLAGAAGPLSVRQANQMAMIVSTGKRLSALVNDILDFSKLKNGELTLQRRPVDLRAVVKAVLGVVGMMSGKRELRFYTEWADDLPLLHTDEDRLQQILYNLLGNAVKFTHRGEIRVKAARAAGGLVAVSVSDTGIGIAPEQLDGIFKGYDQGGREHETSGALRGTGLGLSITKKLVELGGGTIRVRSRLGEGSVFTFTLPMLPDAQARVNPRLDQSAAAAEPAPQVPVLAEAQDVEAAGPVIAPESTILVVDDDQVNLQVLINLLAMAHYEVIAVDNGERALAALEERPDIDLVIADWMMPGMSGLELSRSIRERYRLSELPILMLTARTRPDDIVAGFRAGINDFLGKPVDADELRARVGTLAALRRSVQKTVQTEMAFMQAQIKPHFLYNAMNTIISTCPVEAEQTMELLLELSQYLRSSFDFQNREQLTTLDKELELVRSYLSLEKARFEERLQVDFDVEAEPGSLLPPLCIQPLVENAARHGILQRLHGGRIRVRIVEQGGMVEVEIADDGVGMDPERAAALLQGADGANASDSGTGVGLLNIHRRLLAIYGKGLRIESRPDEGTVVRFAAPQQMRTRGQQGEGREDARNLD